MNNRILLVDDDPEVLELLSMTLSQYGFEPVQTDNARAALKKLSEEPFPVVITDIMMPGMTGVELLEQINAAQRDIQVILMTAHASVDTAIAAVQNGASAYVQKPFDPVKLVAEVNKASEKYRRAEENRRLIEELRFAKEYNEQIIQSLIYTVIVTDAQGRIRKLNRAMEDFLGYQQEEVAGKPLDQLFTEEFRNTRFKELGREKRVFNFPVTFQSKFGKELKATISGTIMKDSSDNIIGFIGTTRNEDEAQ